MNDAARVTEIAPDHYAIEFSCVIDPNRKKWAHG
jgi:hypothetical protein